MNIPQYDMFSSMCITRQILSRITDKWTILVIAALAEQPHHFGELRRKIECISQKMLTQTLRKLENDGLVMRNVIPGNVTKVIYSLTPLGMTFIEPLQGLQKWTFDHAEELAALYQAPARVV